MAEELEIEISPTGQVTVRTIGIKGAKCLDAAEFIARLVGHEKSRELTSEYYEAEQQVQQHLNIRNRHTP
ncbi:MAG: hypothetical protein JWN70_2109 [Planctomycetaceae bacterium]|nr:hypothetical protein [Planctomycetaceae bacterium]